MIFLAVFLNCFQSFAILKISMILTEKLHQGLSDYIQFLFLKKFILIKKQIISSEKIRYMYDYAHSFFGKDF